MSPQWHGKSQTGAAPKKSPVTRARMVKTRRRSGENARLPSVSPLLWFPPWSRRGSDIPHVTAAVYSTHPLGLVLYADFSTTGKSLNAAAAERLVCLCMEVPGRHPPKAATVIIRAPLVSEEIGSAFHCCCCSHINSHNQVRGHRTGSSHWS